MSGKSTGALSDTNIDKPQFDYEMVSSPVANFLKGQADRIRKQCVTSIIQIGKALNEAKRHLSHGAFLRWVEWEVCLPARTAQAYMKVANWAADKNAAVAHLSPSTLYVLSASSTPNEYVTEILSRAESGEIIPPSAVRNELKALRESGRQSADARKLGVAQIVRRQTHPQGVTECECHCYIEELTTFLRGVLSISDFERARELIAHSAHSHGENCPRHCNVVDAKENGENSAKRRDHGMRKGAKRAVHSAIPQ